MTAAAIDNGTIPLRKYTSGVVLTAVRNRVMDSNNRPGKPAIKFIQVSEGFGLKVIGATENPSDLRAALHAAGFGLVVHQLNETLKKQGIRYYENPEILATQAVIDVLTVGDLRELIKIAESYMAVAPEMGNALLKMIGRTLALRWWNLTASLQGYPLEPIGQSVTGFSIKPFDTGNPYTIETLLTILGNVEHYPTLVVPLFTKEELDKADADVLEKGRQLRG